MNRTGWLTCSGVGCKTRRFLRKNNFLVYVERERKYGKYRFALSTLCNSRQHLPRVFRVRKQEHSTRRVIIVQIIYTHTHTPRRPFSFLFKYYSTDRKREWRTTGFREILLCATMTTTTTTRVLWTSKKRRYVFARAIASGFTRGQSDLDSRERRSSWFAFCFFKIARTRREIELHDRRESIIRKKKKKKMRL